MKIKRISIENFKSIKKIEFEFPSSGILVLVGENNSGKSNIIRAIDAICGESWYGRDKLEDRDFYLRNIENQIEIKLFFDNQKSARLRPTTRDWGITYFSNWEQTTKVNFGHPSVKEDFPCTYLGADRTLDKHLSFYDWTLIGRIRRSFHKKIQDKTKNVLNEAFEKIVQIFSQVEGFDNFKNDFTTFFTEFAPNSQSNLEIDFKPFTPANYFKTLQILAKEKSLGNKDIDVDELGEGSRNLILLALLRSYAKNFKDTAEMNGILALEEPELFLHPHARRHLFYILREMASNGMQIILSTHSSSFIDTEFFDEIGRVEKVMGEGQNESTELTICSKSELVSHCHRSGVPVEKCNVDNITEYYKTTSNPRLNEAFFSRCLILVEGETEELCFPELLRHKGIDCDALGISVVSVQGKNQLPKYWRLYSAFRIPIIVVFDNDNTENKKKTNDNIAKCFNIQLKDILDLETTSKILECPRDEQTKILVLNKDFENSLKSEVSEGYYNSLEEEAKKVIKPVGNQQKGVIARYVCRRILSDNNDFTPTAVKNLMEIINSIFKRDD